MLGKSAVHVPRFYFGNMGGYIFQPHLMGFSTSPFNSHQSDTVLLLEVAKVDFSYFTSVENILHTTRLRLTAF